MTKNTIKSKMPITKIILITFISIMIVSNLIIGTVIFKNWFSYAEKGLVNFINTLDKNVYNEVDYFMKNQFTGMNDNKDFNTYLEEIVGRNNQIIVIIEKQSGELVANSLKMDNYLYFQDRSRRRVTIEGIGYPALADGYNNYLDTYKKSYKHKNIQDKFYIRISDYEYENHKWLILTAIPEDRLTSTVKVNILYTMIFALITTFVTINIYSFLIKKLVRPIDFLIRAAEKFGKGDLSQRALVIRDDEIGMISTAFNNMADTIYELVNDLEHKVKERTFELENANEMMLESRNQLKLILDSTAEAIFGLDLDGNCTFCNISSVKMLGYEHQSELVASNMHDKIHHSKKDGTKISLAECRIVKSMRNGETFYTDDEVFWRKNGTCFEVEYHVYPQIKDGVIVGAVVIFMDITESRKAQKHIEYLSYHDSVTGVYNRMFFENELNRIDTKSNLPISIIYGDVNGLKLLNDILGHEKGDELLKKTSDVLKRICRNDDTVARIGGDEFVVLLANTEAKDSEKIIKRIRKEMGNEKIAGIKGSISVASATKIHSEQDIRGVLKNAETEMYKVKTLESRQVNSGMLTDIMESLHEKSQREKLHSINVGKMCEQIAIKMQLTENEVKKAKDAGFYHDIGKIALNNNILNKKGNLDDEENEEMMNHPLIGFRILNLFTETLDIAEGVLTHHERWDGTGYPKGLKGEEIPMVARIIAVAEGYDAMTNKLHGSGATHKEAIEDIKSKSGIKYDPVVVSNFIDL